MGIFTAFEAGNTTTPTIVNSSVGRTREYLTGAEVEAVMAAARKSTPHARQVACRVIIAAPASFLTTLCNALQCGDN
jgi:hypothetical protein